MNNSQPLPRLSSPSRLPPPSSGDGRDLTIPSQTRSQRCPGRVFLRDPLPVTQPEPDEAVRDVADHVIQSHQIEGVRAGLKDKIPYGDRLVAGERRGDGTEIDLANPGSDLLPKVGMVGCCRSRRAKDQ